MDRYPADSRESSYSSHRKISKQKHSIHGHLPENSFDAETFSISPHNRPIRRKSSEGSLKQGGKRSCASAIFLPVLLKRCVKRFTSAPGIISKRLRLLSQENAIGLKKISTERQEGGALHGMELPPIYSVGSGTSSDRHSQSTISDTDPLSHGSSLQLSSLVPESSTRLGSSYLGWADHRKFVQDPNLLDIQLEGSKHNSLPCPQKSELKGDTFHFKRSWKRHKPSVIQSRRIRLEKLHQPTVPRPAPWHTGTVTSSIDMANKEPSTKSEKEVCDELFAAVHALYSTQAERRREPDSDSVIPRAYLDIFQMQRVPLTRENLSAFVRDIGVAALEKINQIDPRICSTRHGLESRPQAPFPPLRKTVRSPALLRKLINTSVMNNLHSLSRYKKIFNPWLGISNGSEFPPFTLKTRSAFTFVDTETRSGDSDTVIVVPMDRQLKDFQRDYFRRLEEAVIKRKSLRCRKRWLKTYRKVRLVLTISKNMAQRSMNFELVPSTYVDIGDSVNVSVDYGDGRSIDTEKYKRKKEISISSVAADTLTSLPKDRTLLQLEEARRELQKVQVFSEYPINVQEQILRRAFYITIGPKRVILRQGHTPQNFFIIICGEAYVKEQEWDEERQIMIAKASSFIKTGSTFGSYALTQGMDRTSSVISRTNMKLLTINGEDYLELFYRRTLADSLPPHIEYLRGMNFMENFPINLLKEKLDVCTMHHFRRNTVITHDSRKSRSLFIIKYGYCKVFRKLGLLDKLELEQEPTMSTKKREEKARDKKAPSTSVIFSTAQQEEVYIERDSPYVNYVEMQSPAGKTVRVPVTKLPGPKDKLYNLPLALPKEVRQYVPLTLLREGEVFGLDQTPMCPFREKSRSTILVSLGAEVIALSKDFYCRHADEEAKEVAEKTFIYDNAFIKRRLRERVNRDVHLEEVLKHYFLKIANIQHDVKKIPDFEIQV